MTAAAEGTGPERASAGVVVGVSPVRLWGMTSTERLRRQFSRAGLTPAETPPEGESALLMRADWVFDESLVRALARRPGAVLTAESGEAVGLHAPAGEAPALAAWLAGGQGGPPAGLTRLAPRELVPAYNEALRKRETALLERLTPEALPTVEGRMFGGSYKGVTDLVTKYVWPVPARAATKLCAVAGLKPNHVTALGLLLTLLTFWLFWRGEFGWGLASGWLMTFLDTVDGKLARVTLTSSKFGNLFDHGIDLIHPPFWWWAWIVGLQQGGHPLANPHLVLAVVVGGYVAQRLEEGVFLRAFKMQIHMWRRFDSWFRLITARRNPNLIILTLALILGRPDTGMELVALWTALSFLVHLLRMGQAAAARAGGPLVSWMAQ
jgi:phosphatidylglycerophosphate synthase